MVLSGRLFTYYIALSTFLVGLSTTAGYAQDQMDTPLPKEGALVADTILTDTTAPTIETSVFDTVLIQAEDDDLEGPIDYKAEDSIVYDLENRVLYLYGNTDVQYEDIEVKAARTTYDWNTSILSAEGQKDSTGEWTSRAIFVNDGKEYLSRRLAYNMKTRQGRSEEIVTEEGEAYITSQVVKKQPNDNWFGYKTRYTTCNHVDAPHFYFQSKRAKVVPDQLMVTGPVNLHVEGVPTPLGLPFGMFPLNQEKQSGIIFPQLRYDYTINGYGLENAGYLWAVNDQLALEFTGSAYTRGLWGVGTKANYVKRYKYDGLASFQFFRSPANDPDLPDARASNDFSIQWTHNMSPKARPNHSFSASIDGQSRGFIGSSLQTGINSLQVNVNSNVNYKRTFPNRRFSLGAVASHRQNLVDGSLAITLPELNFILTRITPFSRNVSTGTKKWYENIGFAYSARAKAQVNTFDSLLLTPEGVDAIQYGINQQAYVDYNAKILKHLNFTPRFNVRERWYFQRNDLSYDPDTTFTYNSEIDGFDTTVALIGRNERPGFFPLHEFDFQTSLSTTLTGIFNFKGKRLKAIRHKIDPALTYTYRPDFGTERWGVYQDVYDNEGNLVNNLSPYQDLAAVYGLPSRNEQNTLGISLRNNLEMKVRNRRDSTQATKKIALLDVFNINTGFNFAADSLKMQQVRLNGSTRLGQYFRLNFGVNFDPYTTNAENKRINQSALSAGQGLLRFQDANVSFTGTIRAPKAKERQKKLQGVLDQQEWMMRRFANYYDFEIPWTLTVGYNLNLRQGHASNPDSLLVQTNNIRIEGDFNLTPKWKLGFNTGYDIRDRDVTLTNVRVIRDLHCWRLAFDWQAYPIDRQSFVIELGVVSSVLQDLKLTRRQPVNQGGF